MNDEKYIQSLRRDIQICQNHIKILLIQLRKWDNLEEVTARYYYLSAKKMGYHPNNVFQIGGDGHGYHKFYDYNKEEFITQEF